MRRLVLVGGGHAHLHVLRSLAERPVEGVETVLVSPHERQLYSGMIPGFLEGTVREDELAIDLRRLAAAARARFVGARAERIDGNAQVVELAGERLEFDVASVDVGSVPDGIDLPGVRDHAWTVRPVERLVRLRERIDELARAGAPVPVSVVGAGAGGVEIALTVERRIREQGGVPRVALIDMAESVLAEFPERVRRRASRLLASRGIETVLGRRVSSVGPGTVSVDGESRASAVTVWVAGAVPPPVLAGSAVPKDMRGYMIVGDRLQVPFGAPVFGAGDCVTLASWPNAPKAGVYAVREAPVLAHNLRAALAGGRMRCYRPQRTYLALLRTGDGRALLRWRGVVAHTGAVLRLKEWIDRRYVQGIRRAYDAR